MSKNKSPKKSKENTIEIHRNHYIHENIKVSEFLDSVINDPDSICTNFEVKCAIQVLQYKSIHEDQSSSKISRELLREAGLIAFIPKGASNPKSPNPIWRYWKKHEKSLFDAIYLIERKVMIIWHKYDKTQIDDAIKEIIESVYEKIPSKSLINRIKKGERSSSAINLALSIFSIQEYIKYYPLHKFYFKTETVKRRQQYFEYINKSKRGVEISKLEKHPIDAINVNKLRTEKELGIYAYQQAYGWFKISRSFFSFPFLCDEEERRNYAKKLIDAKS